MPVDIDNIDLYYGTLNPLSRRLTEAVKSGEEWPNQEVDDSDVTESLLSMLKIKCGEKIVVDFENDDGWTWRDEHSGPFSWMTRSQQDLTALDDIEVQTVSQTKPSRSDTVPKKRLSQQFSSPNDEGGLSEIQAAFQKFGISQVDNDTTEQPIEQEVEDTTFTFYSTDSDTTASHDVISHDFSSHETLDTLSPTAEHRMFTTGDAEVCSSSSITPVHKSLTSNTYKDSSEGAEEEHLMSSTDGSTYTGHISPVFEYDPLDTFQQLDDSKSAESNFDDNHSSDGSTIKLEGVTLGDSCYDNPTDIVDESQDDKIQTQQLDNTATAMVTGYDFLDNW